MHSPRALALLVGAVIVASPGLANAGYIFQNGINSYSGTHDTEVREYDPSSNFGNLLEMSIDEDAASGDDDDAASLLRFDGIFGTDPDQIELGTDIKKATLRLYVISRGHSIDMRLVDTSWTEGGATWNSGLLGGTFLREIHGLGHGGWGPLWHSNSFFDIDVTDEVQAWSDGADNNGWAFTHMDIGSNGVTFATSENLQYAPKLSVKLHGVNEPATLAVFGLGLAGLGYYRRKKTA